jgi:tetratricopeptide (TPR) repeat protein
VEAEQAVRIACDEFESSGLNSHAGEAYYELGEMALRKGDYQDAEAAFRRAHEFGLDPVPGLPLLRLAQGQGESARSSIRRALSETPEDRLRRAKLLVAAIIIELAATDVNAAQEAVEELTDIAQSFGSATFQAHAMMGRGAIELERGSPQAASQALREAWSMFNDTGLPYDAARARVLLARAYLQANNAEDACMQVDSAIKTFTELGAMADLEAATRLRGELGSDR